MTTISLTDNERRVVKEVMWDAINHPFSYSKETKSLLEKVYTKLSK